jgi:hypothetical protein
MAEADTSTSQFEKEPFFGDRGQSIRIRRDARKVTWGGFYFFIYPMIFSVLMVIIFVIFLPEVMPFVLLAALVINGYFANRYIERNTEPAKVFELTRDNACIYSLDDPSEPIMDLPLTSDTTVDVVLNEATTSKEYGHLFGWTFENGPDTIKVCVHEDWELWDIQALRDPIYKVIEHNDMDKGENLKYYRDGRKGVRPLRRSGTSVSPTEPPPTL